MTSIVSWNIQNGKGVDGATDLERIARAVSAMGGADVVCFQEVARHDPRFEDGADQLARLGRLFADFECVFGTALRRGKRTYGNAILSRLPVIQVFNHLLPHPGEGGVKHMQRQALEVVVETKAGPLRVMTTHLEFYSLAHRRAQIARLHEIHAEVAANEAAPAEPDASPYDAVPRPSSLVLCGDFNFTPAFAEYSELFRPPFLDAWRVARADAPHPPTFCVHERSYGDPPDCRDFFAVTADVAARVESMEVDGDTQASDHQPLRLALRD